MPIVIGEKFNIVYLCIVQLSLILCLTCVQVFILTATVKPASSDVVFVQDKSWRLRGCYNISLCVQQKKRIFVSPADHVILYIFFYV